MSWSSKRKTSIILVVVIILVILFAFIGYKIIYRAPTCNDGYQNQGETGIDCGGPCSLVCSSEALSPVVTWKRLFLVGSNVYNAVAYIENPNANAGANNVGYRLRVFNSDGISIYERHGETIIPAKRSVPILETGIALGSQTPVRIEFVFEDPIIWKKETATNNPLSVNSINLDGATTTPSLNAKIQNSDVASYKNIEVVAILYDENGNAMGASRTFIDNINGGETVPVNFNWPTPFSKIPARIEIVPKLFI